MAEEFGRAVLFVEADDSKLRSTLLADEKFVQSSANRMQASMRPIVVGATQVGEATGVAAAGVSTLGSAAALSGNQMVNTTAQIGQLSVAMIVQFNAAKKAREALIGMTKAALAFATSGVGIAIIALGVVAAITAKALFDMSAAEKEAAASAKVLADDAASAEERLQESLATILKRTAILRGADPISFETDPLIAGALRIERAFKEQFERIKESNAALVAQRELVISTAIAMDLSARAELDNQHAINESIRQQIAITKGLAKATDFIEDATQQRLAVELETLKALKQQEEAAKRAAAAAAKPLSLNISQIQTFRTVSLSRTALGGPGSQKVQEVSDKKTQQGLKKIERAVKVNSGVARAA